MNGGIHKINIAEGCVGCFARAHAAESQDAYLQGFGTALMLVALDRRGVGAVLAHLCGEHGHILAIVLGETAKQNGVPQEEVVAKLDRAFGP